MPIHIDIPPNCSSCVLLLGWEASKITQILKAGSLYKDLGFATIATTVNLFSGDFPFCYSDSVFFAFFVTQETKKLESAP